MMNTMYAITWIDRVDWIEYATIQKSEILTASTNTVGDTGFCKTTKKWRVIQWV